MKKKWNNYGMWTALLSAILVFVYALSYAFGFDLPVDFEQKVTGVVLGALGILVVLGLVSDPSKGKWFKDNDK